MNGEAQPVLEVTALTKRYGDQPALRDVGFAVRDGEVLGLIGPNGAGKTTLLELIAGLLPVDSGRIFWRARPLPAQRRREAMFYLPDGIRPYGDQFVEEVLAFFAGTYRRSARELSDIVATVGLGPVLVKRVQSLSKGYNRRLIIALGLITPHPMLLMDEPFDGFDLRQTRDMMAVLRRRRQAAERCCFPSINCATPKRCATASSCSRTGGFAGSARSTSCAREPDARRRSGGHISCAHLIHPRPASHQSGRCS